MATKNTMSDRNLVSKGTSSDDTPTPGFVLKELVSRRECGGVTGRLHLGRPGEVQGPGGSVGSSREEVGSEREAEGSEDYQRRGGEGEET